MSGEHIGDDHISDDHISDDSKEPELTAVGIRTPRKGRCGWLTQRRLVGHAQGSGRRSAVPVEPFTRGNLPRAASNLPRTVSQGAAGVRRRRAMTGRISDDHVGDDWHGAIAARYRPWSGRGQRRSGCSSGKQTGYAGHAWLVFNWLLRSQMWSSLMWSSLLGVPLAPSITYVVITDAVITAWCSFRRSS